MLLAAALSGALAASAWAVPQDALPEPGLSEARPSFNEASLRRVTALVFQAYVTGQGLKTLEAMVPSYPAQTSLIASIAEHPDQLKLDYVQRAFGVGEGLDVHALQRMMASLREEARNSKDPARLSAIISAGRTALEDSSNGGSSFDGSEARPVAPAWLPPGRYRINPNDFQVQQVRAARQEEPAFSPAEVWPLDEAAKPRVNAISARDGQLLINGKAAQQISAKRNDDGSAAETFIHPDDPGLLVKVYSHPSSMAGFERRNAKLENLAPLSATGAAPRIVEQGEAAVAGQGKIYFLVQELVSGLKLRDLPLEDRPRVELAKLLDRVEATGLALIVPGPDQEWLLSHIMIGKTASGGQGAYLLGGSVKAAPAQSLPSHYEMTRSLLNQGPAAPTAAPAQPPAESSKLQELRGDAAQLMVKPATGKALAAILEKHAAAGAASFLSDSPAYALLTLGGAEQAQELAAKLAADEDVAVVRAHPEVMKAVERQLAQARMARLEAEERESLTRRQVEAAALQAAARQEAQKREAERRDAEQAEQERHGLSPLAKIAESVLGGLSDFIGGKSLSDIMTGQSFSDIITGQPTDARQLARLMIDPKVSSINAHAASQELEALLEASPNQAQLSDVEFLLRDAIARYVAGLRDTAWSSDSLYLSDDGTRTLDLFNRYRQLLEARPALAPAALAPLIKTIAPLVLYWDQLPERTPLGQRAQEPRLEAIRGLTALATTVYKSHPDSFSLEDLVEVVNALDARMKDQRGDASAFSPMREAFGGLLVSRSLSSPPAAVLGLKAFDKALLAHCLFARWGLSDLSDFTLADLLGAYTALRSLAQGPEVAGIPVQLVGNRLVPRFTKPTADQEKATQLYRRRFIERAMADPRRAIALLSLGPTGISHPLLWEELSARSPEFKALAFLEEERQGSSATATNDPRPRRRSRQDDGFIAF